MADVDAYAPADLKRDGPTPLSQMDMPALLSRIRRWHKDSIGTVSAWRDEARECFRFRDGDQWSGADRAKLAEEMRPCITYNLISPIIDAVSGTEINSREDITCAPREAMDTGAAEAGTDLIEWCRDECDGEDHESDAFLDSLIGGMGWLEVRVDEVEGERRIVEARVDPFEMVWPAGATSGRNLEGAKWLLRCRKMDREEAESLLPDADPEQLDATWAALAGEGDTDSETDHAYSGGTIDNDLPRSVTLVEAQWVETETVAIVTMPGMPPEELPAAVVAESMDRLRLMEEMTGQPISVEVKRRPCAYQVFVGSHVLGKPMKLPSGGQLTYRCVTGKYDRAKGIYYGLLRAAMDPQRWINKWQSQTLHVMNMGAKKRTLYETGAFVDEDKALEEWTKPGAMVEVEPGGLARVLTQDDNALPTGFERLAESARMFLHFSTGVSPEMLAQQDQVQAGVLEYQRKQASVTILAVFFDNLRRARKHIGRIMLRYLLSGMIEPPVLLRVLGQEGAAGLQALMESGAEGFDVIVQESPASPNAKERAWQLTQPLLPLIEKLGMKPEALAEIVKVSPLPAKLAQTIAESLTSGPTPEQQQQQQVMMAGEQAKVAKTSAEADAKAADAEQTRVETALMPLQAQHGAAMDVAGMAQQAAPDGQAASTAQPQATEADPEFKQVILYALSELQASIQALAELHARPKRVVRGPDGMIQGVEVV